MASTFASDGVTFGKDESRFIEAKTLDFRWVIHEQGTSREHRELQQKSIRSYTNEIGIILDSADVWLPIESVTEDSIKEV